MNEDQPTGQGPQDTKSLVVRSEQTSLAAAAETPFLQQVGFSPELGLRLARLNEIITSRAPAIKKVAIEMIPGEIPLVTTHLTHSGMGYRVYLESDGDKAGLNIKTESEVYTQPLAFTLADVQTFIDSVFPDSEVRFHQFDTLDVSRQGYSGDIDEDLRELTEVRVNEIIHPNKKDITETHGKVDLRVTGEKGTAVLAFNIIDQWDYRFVAPNIRRRPIFHLIGFHFTGEPQRVEAMLEDVNALFDKPEYYTARYDDPWLRDSDSNRE